MVGLCSFINECSLLVAVWDDKDIKFVEDVLLKDLNIIIHCLLVILADLNCASLLKMFKEIMAITLNNVFFT